MSVNDTSDASEFPTAAEIRKASKQRKEFTKKPFEPTQRKYYASEGDDITIEIMRYDDITYRWCMVVNGEPSDVYEGPIRLGAIGVIYWKGYVAQTVGTEGFSSHTQALVTIDAFTPFRMTLCESKLKD